MVRRVASGGLVPGRVTHRIRWILTAGLMAVLMASLAYGLGQLAG